MMRKRLVSKPFPTIVRLIAVSAALVVLLVSCDGEPSEPDIVPESSVPIEKNAVSAAASASSVEAKEESIPSANAETWEGFVYSLEDRSDGKIVMYAERGYYDGNPEPDTERVVYFHAPANSVKLVIPDGVTELDPEAFHDCANLESVVFPNTVNMIPANAFFVDSIDLRIRYPKLKSVVLPVHAAIGSYAFYGLQSLESVTVNRDGKAAALPREDAAIGDNAFGFCLKLKEIVIPEGIKAIGDKVFSTCQKLERVSLPASLKTIGHLAFLNCSLLKEITIPGGVTNIAYDAFFGTPCKESVRREMESRAAAPSPKEN